MKIFGTIAERSGLGKLARFTGVLASMLCGLSLLIVTPALAAESIQAQDFEGYPGIPVYRLWDDETGDFMYTASDEECVSLQYDDGWVYDGIAFYTASSGMPVYRLSNLNAIRGTHLWTDDYNEYSFLSTSQGWIGEDVAWYSSGSVPVHRLYGSASGLHCFTTSDSVLSKLGDDAPWMYEGECFYAESAGTDATPKVVGDLEPQETSVNLTVGSDATVNVGNVTPGTLSAGSTDESVVKASAANGSVALTPVGAGQATVLLQRSADGFYPFDTAEIQVSVAATDLPNVSVWRLYNPNSHEHLFTAQQSEYDQLPKYGWVQEGMAWIAPGSSSTPVYRLYNPNSKDHHYTANQNEYDTLVSQGWKGEGKYWYSDDAERVPVYRIFNPNQKGAGAHQFTTDTNEQRTLVNAGWRDENIGWYGIEKGQPITPPAPSTPTNPSGGSGGSSGSSGGTQPSNPNTEPYYWINTKTHVIHGDSCRSLVNANLSAGHWKKVMTPGEAKSYLSQGYSKCKNCRPTGI